MNEIKKFYVEYCSKPNTRRGTMVPLFYCQKLTGFRSVYLFNEEDALIIKNSQSSSGLNKYTVVSNQLFIDFDGKDAFDKAEEVFYKYRKEDYYVELWFSGMKGFHIVVNIVDMKGTSVPFSQKCYITKEFGNGFCDESLYKNSALIRLPNTTHEKSGNKKHLIMVNSGETLLKIPNINPPEHNKINESSISNIETNLCQTALLEAIRISSINVTEGNRHMTLFYAAGLFSSAGFSYELTKELLMKANSCWKYPKPDIECEKAIFSGFNKPIKR